MKSTVGRPRLVTDEQIARILAWHDDFLEWMAQRESLLTVRELARELGLSSGTIYDVIRTRGEFKQASPENRRAECERRHRYLRQIRAPSRR
jgi:hypothetical protein